jgi:hypothetical protein
MWANRDIENSNAHLYDDIGRNSAGKIVPKISENFVHGWVICMVMMLDLEVSDRSI